MFYIDHVRLSIHLEDDERVTLSRGGESTFSLTVFAHLLHALHHVGSNLSGNDLNAMATTRRTRLLRPFFPSKTENTHVREVR